MKLRSSIETVLHMMAQASKKEPYPVRPVIIGGPVVEDPI